VVFFIKKNEQSEVGIVRITTGSVTKTTPEEECHRGNSDVLDVGGGGDKGASDDFVTVTLLPMRTATWAVLKRVFARSVTNTGGNEVKM
jgi:hypothetical protein